MIEYEIEGKIAKIVGCTNDETNVVIPNVIEDLPVAKIEMNAFESLPKLKSVFIPKSVKVVGGYAFAGCRMLKEVLIEEGGVEVIEDWAFTNCNLKTIKLPASIKNVGEHAFLGNECREIIDEYFAKKNEKPKERIVRPHYACVFPLDLLESAKDLNSSIIDNRASYYDEQLNNLQYELVPFTDLDLPLVFNGKEFVIAVYNKNKLDDITITLSKKHNNLGEYTDDDPDFLLLDFDVRNKDKIITTLTIKTPFLESAEIEILDKTVFEAFQNNRYFLRVKANLVTLGTGNPNKAFKLNHVEDLIGKYNTEKNNKLISEEKFLDITDEALDRSFEIVNEFINNLQGAPLVKYMNELISKIKDDPEIEDKGAIFNFIRNRNKRILDQLSDFDSFEDVCFNIKADSKELSDLLGLTLDILNDKYTTYIYDDEANQISQQKASFMKKNLVNIDENYDAYFEALEKVYNTLLELENKFSVYQFTE